LNASNHIIDYLRHTEMHQRETAFINVVFYKFFKGLNMLSNLDGMILEHSRLKYMNNMRRLKTEISTGSSQESSVPSWDQLRREMPNKDMDITQQSMLKSSSNSESKELLDSMSKNMIRSTSLIIRLSTTTYFSSMAQLLQTLS
jgi:hypothetical protein